MDSGSKLDNLLSVVGDCLVLILVLFCLLLLRIMYPRLVCTGTANVSFFHGKVHWALYHLVDMYFSMLIMFSNSSLVMTSL